jgi:hypothetical protein
MYKAMTIVVGKDMATRNYAKSDADINLEENTEVQSISIEMKENMKKLQKKKKHLPLVHKRGNIEKEIVCKKMMMLKSCLKRSEM